MKQGAYKAIIFGGSEYKYFNSPHTISSCLTAKCGRKYVLFHCIISRLLSNDELAQVHEATSGGNDRGIKLTVRGIEHRQRRQCLPEVVRVHVADVDEISGTQSVQRVGRGLMEKPPASGKRRTFQPRVEHKAPRPQL